MPTIEITTPRGRTVRVQVDRVPDERTIDEIGAEIDRQYDAMQAIAPSPAPKPAAQQQPQGILDRAIHWFMNSRLGRWLSESPTPIAPGGPVARRLPPAPAPQKPTPKPQPTQKPSQKPPQPPQKPRTDIGQAFSQFSLPAQADKPLAQRLAENAAVLQQAQQAAQEQQGGPPMRLVWLLAIPRLAADAAQEQTGSQLRGLHEFLSAPFRAMVAAVGATLPGDTYGVEGGKPVTLRGDWQQRFWQLYSDPELEWGAILEKDARFLPRRLRQGIAIPMDIFLDPLALVPPLKAASIAGRSARVASMGARVAGRGRALLSLLGDPSAMKAAAAVAAEKEAPSLLDVLRFAMTHPQAQQVGASALAARRTAEGGIQAVDEALGELLARPGAERVARLASRDPRVGEMIAQASLDAQARAQQAARETVEQMRRATETHRRQLEQMFRDDEWIGQEELVDRLMFGVPRPELEAQMMSSLVPKPIDAPSAARLRELLRLRQELATNPSIAQQALSLWKFLKTAANFPSSAIRNFAQNFILSWLAGDRYSPAGVARGLADVLLNWREPWRLAGESVSRAAESGADVLSRSVFRRLTNPISRLYQLADTKAASALSKMTGQPAETFLLQHQFLPETAQFLSRTGIMPFISWYLYALPRWGKGLLTAPHRTRSFLHLLRVMQPNDSEDLESIQLPWTRRLRAGGKELPSEVRVGPLLPMDPTEFVGEPGSWLPFIRQNPFVQLVMGASEALAGEGVRGARHTSTGIPALDLAKFLLYFTLPTTISKYVPELVQPQTPIPRARTPRDRIDALLSLLGLPATPADDEWDRWWQTKQQIERVRRRNYFQRNRQTQQR